VLVLEGYRNPVLWDFKKKRARSIGNSERGAFKKMQSRGKKQGRLLIVGPLRRESDTWVLEVRKFEWLPESHRAEMPAPTKAPVVREQGQNTRLVPE
jgi:hypothetical protein